MPRIDIDAARADLSQEIGKAYGLKPTTLGHALRTVGQKLPKAVRQQAQNLDRIESRIAHPKRRGQVNPAELARAQKTSRKALAQVVQDKEADRSRAVINWVGLYVINLGLFAAAYFLALAVF